MMMLAACDDDGAGNGGILRFCLLATDTAGRARQQHEGVCGACVGRGLATAKISTSVCTFLWECRGLLFRLNMKNNETLFCAALSQCPWQKLSTVLLACSFPHSTSFVSFVLLSHTIWQQARRWNVSAAITYTTRCGCHNRMTGRQASSNVLQHVRCFRVCVCRLKQPVTRSYKKKFCPRFDPFFLCVKDF